MTCIVGIEDRAHGVVIIGADSYSSDTSIVKSRSAADPKVFRSGSYVIGFTTSWRMGQILRYHVRLPEPSGRRGLHRHMVTEVIPVIRDEFKRHGWMSRRTDEPERDVGGAFLIGVRGMLFEVASDFQVGHDAEGYDAVGAGYHVALGSLYTSVGTGARSRARMALEAAAAHAAHVRGPFRFLETRP